jgi:hypothetical protein
MYGYQQPADEFGFDPLQPYHMNPIYSPVMWAPNTTMAPPSSVPVLSLSIHPNSSPCQAHSQEMPLLRTRLMLSPRILRRSRSRLKMTKIWRTTFFRSRSLMIYQQGMRAPWSTHTRTVFQNSSQSTMQSCDSQVLPRKAISLGREKDDTCCLLMQGY